jgi:hypothetical protein
MALRSVLLRARSVGRGRRAAFLDLRPASATAVSGRAARLTTQKTEEYG